MGTRPPLRERSGTRRPGRESIGAARPMRRGDRATNRGRAALTRPDRPFGGKFPRPDSRGRRQAACPDDRRPELHQAVQRVFLSRPCDRSTGVRQPTGGPLSPKPVRHRWTFLEASTRGKGRQDRQMRGSCGPVIRLTTFLSRVWTRLLVPPQSRPSACM